MPRRIHDASGKVALEEKLSVKIRRGKFKGLVGRVQFIRRTTGHPRIYVAIGNQGSWMAPRSVEVVS